MEDFIHSSYLWAAPEIVFKEVFQLKGLWGYFVWQVGFCTAHGVLCCTVLDDYLCEESMRLFCGEQSVSISWSFDKLCAWGSCFFLHTCCTLFLVRTSLSTVFVPVSLARDRALALLGCVHFENRG